MSLNKKTIQHILLPNIIPLVGVLFFDWSAFTIILAYCLENIVIGFFHLLKIRIARFEPSVSIHPDAYKKIFFFPPPVAGRLFLFLFFLFHYGFFCFFHIEILSFLATMINTPLVFTGTLLLSLIPLFIEYGQSYVREQKTPAKPNLDKKQIIALLIDPYRRIVVTHLILGMSIVPVAIAAQTYPKIAIVLILLKIYFDQKSTTIAQNIEQSIDSKKV